MAIEIEAARARVQYDMLVLPGLELTYDDADPLRAAHAVAVGLESFVAVDDGIECALRDARRQGAALIAAHPYAPEAAEQAPRATARFAAEWRALAPLVDRWELINRRDVFGWVAEAGLPAVATGDAHEAGHVLTWKTMIFCRKERASVLAHLRSPAPAYLVDAAPCRAAREATVSGRLAAVPQPERAAAVPGLALQCRTITAAHWSRLLAAVRPLGSAAVDERT